MKKILSLSLPCLFLAFGIFNLAQAAETPAPVAIHFQQDGIYVTPKEFSLDNLAGSLHREVERVCAPKKEFRDLEAKVKLQRWVGGSDTQSISIDGTVTCSDD